MTNEWAIRIQGLEKWYGRVQALHGVDIEVLRGEIFGFLGPNGAGKTTTIRCLLDLIRPNSGRIEVMGINPQADPVAVRGLTGYLPGELHFDQNMTVEAALRFYNDLRNGKADWKITQQLADRLELPMKTAVKNLSKGNKQKAGIVQALMHRPKLLILDEPTSGLDPLAAQEVLRMVDEAHADGATVFFSSHILNEVESTADRVGIIRRGAVVEVSNVTDLLDRSLHQLRIRFKQPLDVSGLAAIPGVQLLEKTGESSVQLQIEGEMDTLIKSLSNYPVLTIESERPSLEEIFLAYYK
jgi:ABC-2 type transport system ATP-binding protein